MKTLEIKGTKYTPSVFFNTDKGILMITGRSYPETPEGVFSPIEDALKEVAVPELSVTVELDYINTSSTKALLELLKRAKEMFELSVVWVNEEDDEDVEELGKHFEEILECHFKFRIFV